jgi:RND family efflux transporter MFP subunit
VEQHPGRSWALAHWPQRLLAGLRRPRFWGVLALAAALAGAGGAYYWAQRARDRADPGRARRLGRPIPVRTAPVVLDKVEQVIAATAVTDPSGSATLHVGAGTAAGQTELVVKAVPARQGGHVKEGTVLIELDPTLLEAAVTQRRAEVETARAELGRATEAAAQKPELYKQAVAYARADLERAKEAAGANEQLRKLALTAAESEVKFRKVDVENRRKHRDEMVSLRTKDKTSQTAEYYYEALSKYEKATFDLAKAEHTLQQARKDLAVGPATDREALARAEKVLRQALTDAAVGPRADQEAVAKATASLEAARGHLAVARKELQECQVKAPLDGLVDALTVVPGQRVKTGMTLCRVLRVDPILVKMDFPQERLGEVAPGLLADVVLDSFPGETSHGTVARIDPNVDAKLRVLPVYIEVANPQRRIRPGVSGFVRVRSTKAAAVVPAQAVFAREGRAVVFRVEDGPALLREVRTGVSAGTGLLEVCSGLAPGDQVVIYSDFYHDVGALRQGGGFLQDNDPVDVDWRRWARRDP